MAMADYYQTLGVPRGASQRQITEAFRRLVVKTHPDKSGRDELFREQTEAYETLRDPDKRRIYDISITAPEPQKPLRKRGSDLVVKMKVKASDIANNVPKSITTSRAGICKACKGTGSALKIDDECPRCSGLGYNPVSAIIGPKEPCKACQGYGRVLRGPRCDTCKGSGSDIEQVSTEIRVLPQGTGRILIPGLGNGCPHGGSYGDLFIEVMVERDSLYEIEGLKIKCRIYLTPAQAALGESIPMNVFGRQMNLEIPPGTQAGHLIEIEGGGLESGRRRGNLEARVSIIIPEEMSETLRSLYQQLRNAEKEASWPKT